MTAVAFDTLKFVRTLREKAKMSPEQAEGLADAIAEAVQADLATKADHRETNALLRTEIKETELRLEAKIEAVKADIIKWMFGTIGFQTLIILGAVIALARVIKP